MTLYFAWLYYIPERASVSGVFHHNIVAQPQMCRPPILQIFIAGHKDLLSNKQSIHTALIQSANSLRDLPWLLLLP